MKFVFSTVKKLNKDTVPVLFKKQEIDEIFLENGQKKMIIAAKEEQKINLRKFVLLVRKIIVSAHSQKIKKIVLDWDNLKIFKKLEVIPKELAEIIATNLVMADYKFTAFKEKPKEGWEEIKEVVIIGKLDNQVKAGFREGAIIGEYVNECRELVNTPPMDLTPQRAVKKAREMARKSGRLKIKVFGEKQMKKLKMNAILTVGQGSKKESQLLIMEYNGQAGAGSRAKADQQPIVLVGKGVTFDSGGINLKPEPGMKDMHMDMAGAAAVITTVTLAAKLKVKKKIIGIIPLVENMLSGDSYRPSDIIRSMSGKTIEVNNTDAEGRIILADALTYAVKFKPKLVIDVATLTGAAIVGMGYRASVIITKEKKLEEKLRDLGEKSGDYLWPFPLWDEHEEEIKGTVGDLSNTGKFEKIGGTSTAAAFLYQFAKEYPWVHLDIASRMAAVDDEYLAKGASGTPVRLLIKFLCTN